MVDARELHVDAGIGETASVGEIPAAAVVRRVLLDQQPGQVDGAGEAQHVAQGRPGDARADATVEHTPSHGGRTLGGDRPVDRVLYVRQEPAVRRREPAVVLLDVREPGLPLAEGELEEVEASGIPGDLEAAEDRADLPLIERVEDRGCCRRTAARLDRERGRDAVLGVHVRRCGEVAESGVELGDRCGDRAGAAEVPDLELDGSRDGARHEMEVRSRRRRSRSRRSCPFPAGLGSVSVAGLSSTSPDGSSLSPIGAPAKGDPASERSGVAVIVTPSGTASGGIASVMPPAVSVPPPAPTSALAAAASSATMATLPSKSTVSPISPAWPPGLVTRTVTSPSGASGGTRKLASVPVAWTTAAGWPPTVIVTFFPPKPSRPSRRCRPGR